MRTELREVLSYPEMPERYGDGMTLEQARDDTKYCPLGSFSGGRDRYHPPNSQLLIYAL